MNVSDELFLKVMIIDFLGEMLGRSVWRRTAVRGENMILVFIKDPTWGPHQGGKGSTT